MFDFVQRSRSKRSGAVAHRQGTLVGEERHRASSFGSAKQRTTSRAVQNEGTPSSSVPPSDVSDDAGHRLFHAASAAPYSTPPIMPERPRTSSGPGPGHAFANANKAVEDWDKRMSRDDSHISRKRGTARRERERFDTHQVPIRGSPPSPKESGEEASPPPRLHVRTHTPESISDNNGIITIGMAIGSPSHPPSSGYGETTPQPPRRAVTASSGPILLQPSPALPAALPQGQKSGRWKLFGRNKGKRSKPEMARMATTIPTTTTATATATATAVEPSPLAGETYVAGSRDGSLDRSFTDRKAPRHKPIIIRSQTEPVADSTRGVTSHPERLLRADTGPPGTQFKPESPYLDVEIPSITMERYSVMFGGLLQSQGSASSLLARRQATADRLKSIGGRAAAVDDVVESKEPGQVRRSATSPSLEKSPRLSLFPVPPEATGAATASSSSPRLRSATVPAGLPAHPKERLRDNKQAARGRPQNQDQNQSPSQSQPQVELKAAQPPPLPIKTAAPALKKPTGKRRAGTQQDRQLKVSTSAQDLTPPAPRFSPDQSSLILDSPTESPEVDNEEAWVKERLKPAIFEPKWEMVSPPPPGPAASAPSPSGQAPDNGRAASAARASREDVRRPSASSSSSPLAFASKTQNHAKKPSDDSLDESALQAAVQASITRQISISQQQRDMLGANIRNAEGRRVRPSRLDRSDRRRGGGSPAEQAAVPGVTATATSTSTSSKPSPVAVAAAELASNERLVTTKTATPTLVTPPESSGGSPLAQHRKSERIVLEGG